MTTPLDICHDDYESGLDRRIAELERRSDKKRIGELQRRVAELERRNESLMKVADGLNRQSCDLRFLADVGSAAVDCLRRRSEKQAFDRALRMRAKEEFWAMVASNELKLQEAALTAQEIRTEEQAEIARLLRRVEELEDEIRDLEQDDE